MLMIEDEIKIVNIAIKAIKAFWCMGMVIYVDYPDESLYVK
jgi:uncharacterized membrane protein